MVMRDYSSASIGTPCSPFLRLHERAGDFSGTGAIIYDPSTGNPDGTGRTPFLNDVIPAGEISPITQKIQALIPLPNLPGLANNYFNSASQKMNRKNVDFKTDLNVTDKFHLFFRYGYMQADVSGVFGLGAAGGPCLCDGGPGTGDTFSKYRHSRLHVHIEPDYRVLRRQPMGSHVWGT